MIEFIKDEPHCRWDGTLMSEKNQLELFGVNVDEVINNRIYIANGHIYINADTIQEAICIWLENISYKQDNVTFNDRCDERHGFSKVTSKQVINWNGDIKEDIHRIKLLSCEDTNHWNFAGINTFWKELNNYYNDLL